MENIIAIIAAAVGTVGFALMLRLRYSRLLVVACSTALCFAIFLMADMYVPSFMANLIATIFATFASEFLAKKLKAPVTVFLLPTILPLVPGAHLYYTIESFFNSEFDKALTHFTALGQTIGAILLGIVTVNTIIKCIRNYKEFKNPR